MMKTMLQWAKQHQNIGWLLCLPFVVVLFVWVFDRRPPFEVIGPMTVINGPSGGKVYFDAAVRRDLYRDCSVDFSRYILDGKKFRHDFDKTPGHMTAAGLREMDAAMDHRLKLAVDIPKGAAAGDAEYWVELEYECNPIHILKPIPVHMGLKFRIEQ